MDAVSSVEPFSTGMTQTLHARKVVDSCTGPTKDSPLSGVFATDEFVKKNPKTVAAFQRAYQAAAKIAAGRIGRGAAGLAAFLPALEVLRRSGLVNRAYLPPSPDILVRAAQLTADPRFLGAMAATLRAWGTGMVLATGGGVLLGLLLGVLGYLLNAALPLAERVLLRRHRAGRLGERPSEQAEWRSCAHTRNH